MSFEASTYASAEIVTGLFRYFLAIVICLIAFTIVNKIITQINKPPTCANSKTCKADLTLKIENNALGVFAGKVVTPPKVNLQSNEFADEFAQKKETKVCSAHDESVAMFRGISKTKVDKEGNPKVYWWHKNRSGQMCFGSGYN